MDLRKQEVEQEEQLAVLVRQTEELQKEYANTQVDVHEVTVA